MQVVFLAWASGFSKSVFPNFATLVLGAVLTTGRRTVSHILLTIGELAVAHPSTYHRILSHRRWSMWHLARPMIAYILDTLIPVGVICLAGDETVTEHTGKKVSGKGRHRDAKRSTKSFMAHLWGHGHRPKVGRVVLAILVKFTMTNRPWALELVQEQHRDLSEISRNALASGLCVSNGTGR